jgi:hypothetical protein
MIITNKENICDIRAQILLYEKDYISSKNKIIKYVKKKKFYKKYNNFKYSILLIMENSNYYEFERDILTNNELEIELFNNNHFEYINGLKNFYNITILPLIKFASKLDIITRLQYKLVKKISKKIENVWKTDNIVYELYENEYLVIPSNDESKYFFNILDIIIQEIKNLPNSKINKKNILNDSNYLKLFIQYKNFIDNKIIY